MPYAKIRRIASARKGATAIEYAIIAGLIGLGIVGSLFSTRTSLSTTFSGVGGKIDTATQPDPVYSFVNWGGKTLVGSPTKSYYAPTQYTTWVFRFTDGSRIDVVKQGNGNLKDVTLYDSLTLNSERIIYNNFGTPNYYEDQYYINNPNGSTGVDYINRSNSSGSFGNPPVLPYYDRYTPATDWVRATGSMDRVQAKFASGVSTAAQYGGMSR